jgi:hypothetical protein
MKKIFVALGALCLLNLLALSAPAKMPFAPDETIGLHLGPKNPTFDESKFPEIKFYYTPQLKWSQKVTKGKPEILAKWLTKKGLAQNEIILIDKKGKVDFAGLLIPGKRAIETRDLGFVYTLEESLKEIVEENRESIKSAKKPFKWDWISDIEGRRFPTFEVVDAAGKKTTTAAIINKDEKPKLILVFTIPYSYKFKEPEQQLEGAETFTQALGAVLQIESGTEHTGYLKLIEEDIYGR